MLGRSSSGSKEPTTMAVQETTLDVLREAIYRIQSAEPGASDHGVIQILQGVIDSHAEGSDAAPTSEWQPPARVEPEEPTPPPVTSGPVRHRTNQLFKNI